VGLFKFSRYQGLVLILSSSLIFGIDLGLLGCLPVCFAEMSGRRDAAEEYPRNMELCAPVIFAVRWRLWNFTLQWVLFIIDLKYSDDSSYLPKNSNLSVTNLIQQRTCQPLSNNCGVAVNLLLLPVSGMGSEWERLHFPNREQPASFGLNRHGTWTWMVCVHPFD